MSKLTIIGLYAKLCGFKVLVRANRFGCDTRFAQVVHDRLLAALELHIDTCQRALQAQRALRVERDPVICEDLHQTIEDVWADCDGRGFYPWHLLDCIDPEMDWGGYRDPSAGMWVPRPIPERFTVDDKHLCGLGEIIGRIAAETGIRFTTYLYYDCIGPDGAGSLDPDIYERPLGNNLYR